MDTKNNSALSVAISRMAANIIDNILLALLTFFIVLILTFTSFDILQLGTFIEMLQVDPYTLDTKPTHSYELLKSMAFFLTSLSLLYALVSLVYFQSLLTGNKRATFGMQLFGLELVSIDKKNKHISFIKVSGRTILFIVLKAVYVGGISIITMFVTKEFQTLHDMPFGTTIKFKK